MLGRGIREILLGAGAIGKRRAIVQMDALPVLFVGTRDLSAISGLFSFSVESVDLTALKAPSTGGKGNDGLKPLFSVSGRTRFICSFPSMLLNDPWRFFRVPNGLLASCGLADLWSSDSVFICCCCCCCCCCSAILASTC